MHSSSYFYIIIWFLIPFLFGSESSSLDSSAQSSLDSLLRQYAFRELTGRRTRNGVPYDAYVPSSLTGVKVSAMILKTHSLKRKVCGYYKNFFIPSGIIEEPYVKKLVLVYQNLANWSSFYYPLPGYTYLAPVFGILAYDAHNLYAKFLRDLDIQALEDPISIKFPYVHLAPEGSFPKCVYFYSNNFVQFGHVKDGNVCETRMQGHFSIVAEVKVAPSPPPTANDTAPSPAPSAYDTAPSSAPSAYDTAPSPAPSACGTAPSPAPSANDTAPSPAPSAYDTAPSPAPSAYDTAPNPAPNAYDTAPSPAPDAYDTEPSPSPSANDTAPSPAPNAYDTAPSPAPGAYDTAPSPSPSANDTAPSPAPNAYDTAPSPAPSANDTAPSPSAYDTAPSPSPSANDTAPSLAPSAYDITPSPAPSANDIAPSPAPIAYDTVPSPSPSANDTAPSPSPTPDENNHQKINSKTWTISYVFLFFSLTGMLFVAVNKSGLLEIRQKLYDSAAVVVPLLEKTEVPLPLEAPTRPLLENDYVL